MFSVPAILVALFPTLMAGVIYLWMLWTNITENTAYAATGQKGFVQKQESDRSSASLRALAVSANSEGKGTKSLIGEDGKL